MLRELHKDKTPEGVARYENVEELLAGHERVLRTRSSRPPGRPPDHGGLPRGRGVAHRCRQDDGDDDKVSLMTIHAAKGLEFPYICSGPGGEPVPQPDGPQHPRGTGRGAPPVLRRADPGGLKQALSYALTRYQVGPIDPERALPLHRGNRRTIPESAHESRSDFNTARTTFYKPMPSGSGPRTTTPAQAEHEKGIGLHPGCAAESSVAPASSGGIAPGVEVGMRASARARCSSWRAKSPTSRPPSSFPQRARSSCSRQKFAKLGVLG